MWPSRDHSLFYSFLLLPSLSSALTFDCTHLRVEGHRYDFSALGGPHSVIIPQDTPPSITNTTYTIDLCYPLEKKSNVPKLDQCHAGARVCAIKRVYNPADDKTVVQEVIDIAGEYSTSAGGKRALEPKYKRLKKSNSEDDGIQLELNGGRHPWDGKGGRKQQAIIQFICDHDRTGLEGLESEERADADEKESEGPDQSLIFRSRGAVDEVDILRLDWRTKYACEDTSGGKDDEKGDDASSHWGFFTWFIVIAFLGIAAYLIFGSWLNYNRYGARGWDLLPHGDTIRDIPYLLRDWIRRVVNTVQGGGSRGGYSAV